jgi:hypothetical protein
MMNCGREGLVKVAMYVSEKMFAMLLAGSDCDL